jgi:hypothetical protein
MSETGGAIAEVLKWIRVSVRPVIVLLIVSVLALFIPSSLALKFGLNEWLQRFHPWIVLVFTCSFVWVLTYPVERWYRTRQRKKRLQNLASDEQDALRPYIQNGKTIHTFSAWQNIGLAKNLASLGILSDTLGRDGGQNPHYAIDPWTYEYLRKNPDLVGLPKS